MDCRLPERDVLDVEEDGRWLMDWRDERLARDAGRPLKVLW